MPFSAVPVAWTETGSMVQDRMESRKLFNQLSSPTLITFILSAFSLFLCLSVFFSGCAVGPMAASLESSASFISSPSSSSIRPSICSLKMLSCTNTQHCHLGQKWGGVYGEDNYCCTVLCTAQFQHYHQSTPYTASNQMPSATPETRADPQLTPLYMPFNNRYSVEGYLCSNDIKCVLRCMKQEKKKI